MSYTVLARRYRSRTFDDVVGQAPIARTLKQAVRNQRIHHAYMFTGTRGIGKTSMARILAKALNCVGPEGEVDQPTPEPCGQCETCQAIGRGDDLDVIEIDGASNNSVDAARDLIANSIYQPARSRYKVYIIDEVHMLSQAAFNTLLKTLEEPPAHVRFIFATTEPHKVLPTIHSRCQRFDFRNIPAGEIAHHLQAILAAEQVQAEERVVHQIARLAQGSMRDALSLLDRLLAAADGAITADLLEEMLGLPDVELIHGLIRSVAASDVPGTLKQVHELLARGIAQEQLLGSLIEQLRNLMLVAACGSESGLVDVDEATRMQVEELAGSFDVPMLVHMIALAENLQRASKSSPNPQAMLEAGMVRLALSEQFASLAALTAGEAGDGGKKKSGRSKRTRAA